jgi:drug/metabolite transporter superfamily protein YnfA
LDVREAGHQIDESRTGPDRSDLIGAGICLIGVAVIMYAR